MNKWPEGQWLIDEFGRGSLSAYKVDEVIASAITPYQKVDIIRNEDWGICLFLDDRIQSAEEDEFIYHESLVHLPMLASRRPEKVLIIGGGEGATLREVLTHRRVKQVTMIDIDSDLVEMCHKHMPTWSNGAFSDHRVSVLNMDARTYLQEWNAGAINRFDVVIIDLTEPVEDGPSVMLYTKEWYELVSKVMQPAGTMGIQVGSADLKGTFMPSVMKTLKEVFSFATPYTAFIPSFMNNWGFALCGKTYLDHVTPNYLAERSAKDMMEPFSRMCFSPWFAYVATLIPPYMAKKFELEGRVLTDEEPYEPSKEHEHRF